VPWSVEVRREPPGAFHARTVPDPFARAAWVCEPTAPALVLGSTQRDEVVDADACRAAGIDVVRRRSGGGAVLVEPGAILWIDVLLPAGDPLWLDDVAQAFLWLGRVWADALATLGVEARVHEGGLCTTQWSRLVCFGGLGTGEVVDADGRKLVGISQRRTRAGARFQCMAHASWEAERLVGLLALDPAERSDAASALADVARGVPVPLGPLQDAVLAQLATR
jgi:lipoate-protein ligase A